MIRVLTPVLLLSFSFTLCANDGVNLLLGSDSASSQNIVTSQQAKIELDDPFRIQFYGAWREINDNKSKLAPMVDDILSKRYKQALSKVLVMPSNLSAKEIRLAKMAEIYLLYRLDFSQTFVNLFIQNLEDNSSHVSSFAVAFDQTFLNLSGDWFLEKGIYLSNSQKEKVLKMKTKNSHMLNLIQSFASLGKGKSALMHIAHLKNKDKLKQALADSAIVDFAREGELGKSGAILKEVYTSELEKSSDLESLSAYHLTLARLLYQASALEAADHYFSLIPEKSKHYLNARTERLWISLHSKDHGRVKGDLATLDLDVFNDKFIPEIYLVSSIAHLRVCQFKDVANAFDSFLRVNRKNAKEIALNLSSEKPKVLDTNDFYYVLSQRTVQNLAAETKKLEKDYPKVSEKYVAALSQELKLAKEDSLKTIRRKWKNREKILELTIRRMRFVKIEYLSQMRRFNKLAAGKLVQDNIKTVSSGLKKTRDLQFPHDGVFFSDELFHVNSEVKDLCLRSQK